VKTCYLNKIAIFATGLKVLALTLLRMKVDSEDDVTVVTFSNVRTAVAKLLLSV
jgi:hypothetical protein